MLLAASTADAASYGFAFRLGASSDDSGAAIAADSAGNIYVAGLCDGTLDFDPGGGTANRSGDAFAAKYTATGSLVWARTITGDIRYDGADICVDGGGNVYLTGGFLGRVDFDPGSGTAYLNSGPQPAAFVLKLNSSGNFVWARSFSGGKAGGLGIAVDGSGNVYTTGFFATTVDFDPGPGVQPMGSAGLYDVYVSKLDRSGNYLWARRVGGAYPTNYPEDPVDWGRDIALDPDGNVYTTGTFRGQIDFDPGPGEYLLTSSGNVGGDYYNDAFVWKLNTDGNFVWARRLGGPAEGRSIAIDAQRNVYSAGVFFGNDADFDPGAGVHRVRSSGDKTVYVSKLNPSGDFLWADGLASIPVNPYTDSQVSLGLDARGSVYVAGQFRGTPNFDPAAGTFTLTSAGGSDVFVARLDAQTGSLGWADALGGPGDDLALGLAVGPGSNVYTTGSFRGKADFNPTAATGYLTSAGSDDVFVSKLTYERVSRLTLSTTSSTPFRELTVASDAPLDTSSPLTARFTNPSGYAVDVPVLSSTADAATIVVPPYVHPTSGEFQAGAVEVQLVQGGRVVAAGASPLEILGLLESSLPLGTITLGYLRSASEEARAQQDALRWTILDTTGHNATLAAVAERLDWLVGQVEGIVNAPSQSINLGKAGTKDIVLDAAAVARLDRLLQTAISGEAALGTLPAMKSGSLVPTQSTGTRLTVAEELSEMFLGGEEPAASVWSHYANVARTSLESLDDDLLYDLSMYHVGLGGALIGIGLAPMAAGAGVVAGAAIGAPVIGAGLVLAAGGALVQADLEQPGTIDALIDKTKHAMDAADRETARLAAAAKGTILAIAQDVKAALAAFQSVSKTRPTGEVHIQSVGAPITYEDHARPHAVFKVWLTNAPSGAVTLHFDVDDDSEGQVILGNQIVFGPGDRGPREVWVKGVDDDYADGDQLYFLHATIISQNPDFRITTTEQGLSNFDNEPEMTISIQDASVVEGGSWQRPKVQVPVTLSTLSDKPVTFRYRTAQASAKAGVDFVSVPWTTKTIPAGVRTVNVSVTIIGDDYVNSTDPLSFYVSIAPVSDIRAARPLAQVSIHDDDVARVIVQPLDTETSSLGDSGAFRMKLGSKPRANVKVAIRSDAPAEGKPLTSSVAFSPDNWSRWQTVTVKGQAGGASAGDIEYHIVTSNAISQDAHYSGLDVDDVAMINHVAAPGVTLEVLDDQTSSAGGTGSFRARLNTKPSDNVTIMLLSDNNNEGKVVKVVNSAGNVVSAGSFIFTPSNWSAWQTATVKGQPSGHEGLNPYTILTSATSSTDPKYNGLDVPDVPMVNHVEVKPGPWTVWIRLMSADVGVQDGFRTHQIDTSVGRYVGKYENQSLVTLFSIDNRGISTWAYWSYAGHTTYDLGIELSANMLRNGVVVSVSDAPLSAAAAALGPGGAGSWRGIGQVDRGATNVPGGSSSEILAAGPRRGLRPQAVDAILAEDFDRA